MSIRRSAAADLPADVLNHIQSLLPIDDYVRFPAVCARWCSAAKRNPNPPSDGVPWLFTFYFATFCIPAFRPSPANDRPLADYGIPFPRLESLSLCIPLLSLISSLGPHLVFCNRKKQKLLLVNPFSSSVIPLPDDVIPGSRGPISVSSFQKLLAPPDYDGRHGIALALLGYKGKGSYSAAYSTSGGPWIDLNDEDYDNSLVSPLRGQRFIDAVHYKGALFFALRNDEQAEAVVALDFSSLSSSCPFPAVVDMTLNLVDDYPSGTMQLSHGCYIEASLVISPPYLYLVRWRRRLVNLAGSHLLGCHPTGDVYVYRLPLPQEEDEDALLQRQRWIQVNELSGCSFFLGEDDSISVSTRDCPALKPDHNLADGSWEEYYGSGDHKSITIQDYRPSSSRWMMPRLMLRSASPSELPHSD